MVAVEENDPAQIVDMMRCYGVHAEVILCHDAVATLVTNAEA